MRDYNFQVDLKGLISLLSNHLYSKDDVFIRELLQNGVDAVTARKLFDKKFQDGCLIIEYIEKKTGIEIICRDNGIGLTKKEIHQFLAVIGQSSKRGEEVRNSFIGQFGVGLLSCFLVADEIEVITHSIKDRRGYRWIGYNNGTYEVKEISCGKTFGTQIHIKLKKGIANRFSRSVVSQGILNFGCLLPIPIWFRYRETEYHINHIPIPWRQEVCTKETILEFGRFMFQEEFLDAFPLQAEGIHGYLYISTNPIAIGENAHHKIYLHSMLLTEDGRDLIPKWATFARCLMDAEDLTPTASREGLQRDSKQIRAKAVIEACLFTYLTELTKFDITKMKQLAVIHNLSFKAFALENDKILSMLFPFLIFSTNKGKLTGAQILKASKRTTVFYCVDIDTYRRTASFLEYSNSLLINGSYIYEAQILSRLVALNSNISIKMFDDSLFDELFEEPTEQEKKEFTLFLSEAMEELKSVNCRMIVKRLFPPELPAIFIEEEGFCLEAELETDLDEFSFLDGFENLNPLNDFSNKTTHATLYINSNNKLLRSLSKVVVPNIIHAATKVLYVQARLAGHYSVSEKELDVLTRGLTELIAYSTGGENDVL